MNATQKPTRLDKLTLLLLLPTVVSEVGDIVFLHTFLHLLQVSSRVLFMKALSHVERHLQRRRMPLLNVSR